MPLNLSQLQPILAKLGLEAKQQADQRAQHHISVQEWLQTYGSDLQRLSELAGQALENHWPVACPASIDDVPLQSARPLPPHPSHVNLVASDGSPIAPDRHGAALYYVINIGSIVYRHGSGQRPQIDTASELGYTRNRLYENGRLIQGNLLDVRMQIAEMKRLAELAESIAHEGPPTLALTDGSLLLWLLDEDNRDWRQQKLDAYLESWNRIRHAGAALAGVISRPRRREVVDLLFLASQSAAQPTVRSLRDQARALDLADRELFTFLEPGERSVTFRSTASLMEDPKKGSSEIAFYYQNVGSAQIAEIVRVEVPAWALEMQLPIDDDHSMNALDLLHAAIDKQCRILRRYPYVLARAHELAVVGVKERHDLEMMIQAHLAQQGLLGTPSEKQSAKEAVGSGQ